MPSSQQIQRQIKSLGLSSTFGVKKEIQCLPKILSGDESILGVTTGFYDNNIWLLVCTPKRVIFLDKGLVFGIKQKEFPMNKITSIEYKTGMLFGKLKIHSSSSDIEVKQVDKDTIHGFVNAIHRAISSMDKKGATPSSQSAVTIAEPDLITQLERLSILREKGVLTYDEFEVQKQILLQGKTHDKLQDDVKTHSHNQHPTELQNLLPIGEAIMNADDSLSVYTSQVVNPTPSQGHLLAPPTSPSTNTRHISKSKKQKNKPKHRPGTVPGWVVAVTLSFMFLVVLPGAFALFDTSKTPNQTFPQTPSKLHISPKATGKLAPKTTEVSTTTTPSHTIPEKRLAAAKVIQKLFDQSVFKGWQIRFLVRGENCDVLHVEGYTILDPSIYQAMAYGTVLYGKILPGGVNAFAFKHGFVNIVYTNDGDPQYVSFGPNNYTADQVKKLPLSTPEIAKIDTNEEIVTDNKMKSGPVLPFEEAKSYLLKVFNDNFIIPRNNAKARTSLEIKNSSLIFTSIMELGGFSASENQSCELRYLDQNRVEGSSGHISIWAIDEERRVTISTLPKKFWAMNLIYDRSKYSEGKIISCIQKIISDNIGN